MKRNFGKILILFVAIATLSLTSCSKDPAELIVGKWDVTKVSADVTLMGNSFNLDLTKLIESLTFNEDGTCVTVGHEAQVEDFGAVIFDEDPYIANGTWVMNGDDQIIITNDGYPETYTIQKLKKDECTLSISEHEAEPDFTLDATMTIEMVK